jgi:hypothetical protein
MAAAWNLQCRTVNPYLIAGVHKNADAESDDLTSHTPAHITRNAPPVLNPSLRRAR